MKIIKGDITKVATANTDLIMHQVNCQSAMGAGVARALYLKYPAVKSEYLAYSATKTPATLLGDMQFVETGKNTPIVINSFTQLEYGNALVDRKVYTDETKLIDNLLRADNFAKRNGLTLYIPARIGSALAGGNWQHILNAIKDTDIIVVDFEA
jgi:Predicted phosphatase homologous to the C-terminal domain of histone macroH2A1